MSRHRELQHLRHLLLRLIDSLQPDEIKSVGPYLLGAMAAYSNSPAFYRRRRAECLHTAIWFRLLSIETGKNRSDAIKHHLARGLEWRRKEYATTAPLALKHQRAA